MKIIKYKKEKSGKYKIYLEDGTTIDTYEDVIINNNLLVKKEIEHCIYIVLILDLDSKM